MSETVQLDPPTPREMRDAMGSFATGVTVVTGYADARAIEDVALDLRDLGGQRRIGLADERHDLVSVVEQRADEVPAEKAGGSGDEIATHGGSGSRWSRRRKGHRGGGRLGSS